MNKTKDQQAQEYAEKKSIALRKAWYLYRYGGMHDPDDWTRDTVKPSGNFECGFNAGVSFCEQSMWRSVEDELPSNDNNVLVYVPSTEFRIGGYEVAYYDGEDWYTSDGEHIRPTHFMYIPSLPDTNTENH